VPPPQKIFITYSRKSAVFPLTANAMNARTDVDLGPMRYPKSLSVQCNTMHGTEYKITCGVCLCVRVCARDFGVEYLENVKR